jgi:hypothetical protein
LARAYFKPSLAFVTLLVFFAALDGTGELQPQRRSKIPWDASKRRPLPDIPEDCMIDLARNLFCDEGIEYELRRG